MEALRADITSLITSGLYDDAVVFAAISALERLGMLSEAELLATLNNAHPSIRWIMLKALTRVNPEPRSIGLLASLMLDPSQSPALRSMIIHNMIHVNDARLHEPLIALLKDNSPSVRQHAALSLGEKMYKTRKLHCFSFSSMKTKWFVWRQVLLLVRLVIRVPFHFTQVHSRR